MARKNRYRLHPAASSYLDSLGMFGWQLGLERIQRLAAFCGNPERRYPVVHLAGTNGKGSTAAMIAAIGRAAGLRVGLYTSPHLVEVVERLQIDGVPVTAGAFEQALRHVRPLADELQATYFEVVTAIAFQLFAQSKVELAVIETGLGGRLDATNIVQPEVSVITAIGLEHQQFLGRTHAKIAAEKAGIIKAGVPCVFNVAPASAKSAILQRCEELAAPSFDTRSLITCTGVRHTPSHCKFHARLAALQFELRDLCVNLPGGFQIRNAGSAILTAKLLNHRGIILSDRAITEGLRQVHWPAHLQKVQERPLIVIDNAHNDQSMKGLARAISRLFEYRRLFLVISLMRDKPAAAMMRRWRTMRPRCFVTAATAERALPAAQLCQIAHDEGLQAIVAETPQRAYVAALAASRPEDLILVTGSHYLIGDLMKSGQLPLPY